MSAKDLRCSATIVIYRGTDGQSYWRSIRKGRITADGAEGHPRRDQALRAARVEVKALRGRVKIVDGVGVMLGFVEAES